MDQHRDVLATYGRQADRAQEQKSLEELRKLVDRMHAVRRAYWQLARGAQQNLENALVLKEEIDTFIKSCELSHRFDKTSSGGRTEKSIEPKP